MKKKPAAKDGAMDGADDTVAMVPGNNGGRLLAGGKPGNRGGSGRPASALRALIGESFRERWAIAEEIAEGGVLDRDRLKAVDLLHRWAGLDKIGLPDELLREMASDLRAEIDDEAAIGRIFDRWKVTLAAYLARHL